MTRCIICGRRLWFRGWLCCALAVLAPPLPSRMGSEGVLTSGVWEALPTRSSTPDPLKRQARRCI